MYRLYHPAPALRPYIDNYWMLRVSHTPLQPLTEAIYVDGKADMIFNFGVPYARDTQQTASESIALSNLDAQRRYPVSIVQVGAIDLVGVRFKVGGLSAFLPVPIFELSDAVVEIDHMFDRDVRVLEGQLYDALHDDMERVNHLDKFFLQHLHLTDQHRLVSGIVDYITHQYSEVSIQQMSDHFGYSIRSLDRYFLHHVGFSPKWYARIARFQQVLRWLSSEHGLSLAQIAHRAGYYDQAHFSKDFKAFSGYTPSEFRGTLVARLTQPPPNLVQFLQDPQSSSLLE